MMMLMAARVMVMVGASNHGNGYEYGNADSDTGNAILLSLCPHSSVSRPSLHSPSTAQDFHSFAGGICCKGLADLRPCDHTDLGPSAWSNSTWFPKSPRAKSTLLSADLGPRTEEQLQLEQRCEVHGLHHGRGCRQELLLHTLRRAQLWFPHRRQVQSPDGQSDQGHHVRHPKIKLPHISQTRSPGRRSCTQSLCLPHTHHCVKRKLMELHSTQAQQSRLTHS